MTSFRITAALAAIAGLAFFAGPASAQVTPTVTVIGVQAEEVANDTSSLAFGVSERRSTKPAALAALSRRVRRVISRAQKAGSIANSEISTRAVSISRRSIRNRDREVVGQFFVASTHVDLIVLRVKRTGVVVSAGVRAGANHIDGPRYYVLDSEDRYQDALLKAFDKAKAKARALATRSGRELGAALSITEGGGVFSLFDVDDEFAALTDGGSTPPVRSGKSRVVGRVSVVFEMS